MTPLLLSLASAAACAVILWRAEPALNRMSATTPNTVRLALWLITVGAAAQLVALGMGSAPQWPTVVLELGVACLLYCERRLRVLIPSPRQPHRDTP
jgi:hypothetical protein